MQYYKKRRHDGYFKLWRRFDNFLKIACVMYIYSTYRNRDVIIYQQMLSITEGRQRIAVIHLLDKGNIYDKRRSHKVYNALQIQWMIATGHDLKLILWSSSLPYMYTIAIHLHIRKSTEIKIIHVKFENVVCEPFYYY